MSKLTLGLIVIRAAMASRVRWVWFSNRTPVPLVCLDKFVKGTARMENIELLETFLVRQVIWNAAAATFVKSGAQVSLAEQPLI